MIFLIGIYKIVNNINSKIYIGQSINIHKRWYEHKYKSNYIDDRSFNSLLHQAIRKYGIENFSFEIIEQFSEKDCLLIDEREQFYISFYNCITPNGYNILNGGQKIRAIPRFCKKCGIAITSDSSTGYCHPCSNFNQRVCERPSKEELINLLYKYNFLQVSKQFGVSDTAVRKWCRNYGISDKSKDYNLKENT